MKKESGLLWKDIGYIGISRLVIGISSLTLYIAKGTGRDEKDRTFDLTIINRVLCQLSYIPITMCVRRTSSAADMLLTEIAVW